MNYLQIILGFVFGLLSLTHFYWAFGGRWWFTKTLPMNHAGHYVLNPGKGTTIIVSLGLLSFALYYATLWVGYTSTMMTDVVGWIIPTIFLLRAMGDFRYVGFFKKVTSTEFASYDSRYYSPLCLIIGVMGVIIALQV